MSNYIPDNLTKQQQDRHDKVMSLKTTKGGRTNVSLKSIGVNTPPTSGWLRRYVLNGPDYEPEEDTQLPLL